MPQETVRLILGASPTNRDSVATRDSRYLNCFPETIENPITGSKRVYVQKRPGYSSYSNPPGTTGAGRGLYYWDRTSKLYSVIANKLYSGTSAIQTINTSTGQVAWASIEGTTNYLLMIDGTDGWTINTSDTVAEITDADYPTATKKSIVGMDGYVFVINSSTGAIANCSVNDPTTWISTDTITPQVFTDLTIALLKQRSLIVALGTESTEFFEITDNPTGSPLSRIKQYSTQIGCVGENTIANADEYNMWVARLPEGGRFVAMLNEFTIQPVSNEAINRILEEEGSNISTAEAFFVRSKGHLQYILNLTNQNRTLVYDVNEKQWHEWESLSGTDYVRFAGVASTELNGATLILHRTDGKIYTLDPEVYQDASVNFRVIVRTHPFDADTTKRKFCSRFELIGDRHSSSSTINVQYSDDEYVTTSTARTVDLNARMFLKQLGNFRRRAWILTHEGNAPFRVEAIEMDVELGTS